MDVDMFGRDSDSDSESSEASTTEENATFPGGGAAGGFLGQLHGTVARPGAGKGTDAAPPTEGKALDGEEEDQEEASPPPQTQGGAQPKKTLPRPVYEGDAGALFKMLMEAAKARVEPDIAKVRELLDAGIDVRYQVRIPCVCVLVVEY